MSAWWNSIAQIFKRPQQDPRGSRAQLRRAEAYQAVFRGNPTRTDQEIVLADLASYTRFFMFHPSVVSNDELRYVEGMRSVFGHIHGQLTLTPEQSEGLQTAARIEASAGTTEEDWEH